LGLTRVQNHAPLARIIHEGADFARDTNASAW
jgi:hypothetical protein